MKLQELGAKIKEIFVNNKKIAAGAGVIVVLAIILIATTVGSDKSKKEEAKKDGEPELSEEENWALLPNDLEEDAYPQINKLVESYYKSVAEGNVEEVKQLVNELSGASEKEINDRKEIVESYENIKCYTKRGPEPNTYIVFAYTETKFVDIETLVPGLKALYVTGEVTVTAEDDKDANAEDKKEDADAEDKKEDADAEDKKEDAGADNSEGADNNEEADSTDGSADEDSSEDEKSAEDTEKSEKEAEEISIEGFEMVTDDLSEEIGEYIATMSEEQDVKDLYAQVNEAYIKALESDQDLNKFVAKLREISEEAKKAAEAEEEKRKQEEEDAKKAAAEEEQQPEEPAAEPEEPASEEPAAEEPQEETEEQKKTKANQGAPGRTVTLSNTLNVRASFDEGARLVYTIAPGEKVKVIMDYEEGWSKITVLDNGKTGYVKTMYLE